MPEQGPYYSTNEANAASWPPLAYRDYLAMLLRGEAGSARPTARGISGAWWRTSTARCSKVACLPLPAHRQGSGKGKLRLLYEANPLAMLAEQAGGAAVYGAGRILEIVPEKVHQRTALIVGSKVEVEALRGMVAG